MYQFTRIDISYSYDIAIQVKYITTQDEYTHPRYC